MADLAAALVMGIALLGLIYWYFSLEQRRPGPASRSDDADAGGPGAQALDEGEGDLEDSTTRTDAAGLRGGTPASESAHAKTTGSHGRTERVLERRLEAIERLIAPRRRR